MNAIEFVKKFGRQEAIKVVDLHPVSTLINIDGSCVSILELKQIVEAFEIIGLFKNLEHAKIELLACEKAMHSQVLVKLDIGMGYIDTSRVKKAINIVEQCKND